MFDIQVLIDRLLQQTSYPVEAARVEAPNLQSNIELPFVYVNYYSIDKIQGSPDETDILNSYGEDLIQTFQVQIVCVQSDLPEIWRNVYTALKGYTPVPTNTSTAAVSGLTFKAGATQQSNNKIWDVSHWCIAFPSVNVLF